jgi:hemoglobin
MSETLFDRLGGGQRVHQLVDRILELHQVNDRVKRRFTHLDEAQLSRARSMAREFFTAGTGGPGEYTGKPMPEAHRGMNIGADEYLAVVDDIMQALGEFEYPPDVCNEVLGIAYSLKGQIMQQ